MKNILIAIILLTCLTGCEYERVKIDKPIETSIHDIEWDGHTYIICTSILGGCDIIHSESCECNKNINKEN